MIYDGHKKQFGVDTSSVDFQSREFNSDSVNRSYTHFVNDTRPPFVEWNTIFKNFEDETTFRTMPVTGCYFYNGIPPFTKPCIIVAVGDTILRGKVFSHTIIFERLYKGINPTWQFSFFVQAGSILVFQNGKDLPLFWNGNVTQQMKPVHESSLVADRPMMVGNLMVYAHGRIWLGTENDLIYASDHIYSQGIGAGKDEAVLRFSESFYPSSGDGFGAPSEFGALTGLTLIPRHPELNGHGEILALHRNGAYTINGGLSPRNTWTDAQMTQIVYSGGGCAAPNSTATINSNIFYRDCDTGISSFQYSESRQQEFDIDTSSISTEVSKYLDFDRSPMIQFCSSIFTNNRLISTCAITKEASSVADSFHRYANGMVVMSLQKNRSATGTKVISWDGLWTGPRVTCCCNGFFDGRKKNFFFSFDTDKQNRVYHLTENRGNDIIGGVEKKIVSFYIQRGIFDDINEQKPMIEKSLNSHSISYAGAVGEVTFDSFYSPDDYECFTPLMENRKVNCDNPCANETGECNSGKTYQPKAGIVVSDLIKDKNTGRQSSKESVYKSNFFAIKTKITGVAKIKLNQLQAEATSQRTNSHLTDSCLNECEGINCCPSDNDLFANQF